LHKQLSCIFVVIKKILWPEFKQNTMEHPSASHIWHPFCYDFTDLSLGNRLWTSKCSPSDKSSFVTVLAASRLSDFVTFRSLTVRESSSRGGSSFLKTETFHLWTNQISLGKSPCPSESILKGDNSRVNVVYINDPSLWMYDIILLLLQLVAINE